MKVPALTAHSHTPRHCRVSPPDDRVPATSASMVICAAGLSLARSAALQALRLPPPHPSPSCAAGSLASVRDPRTARTPRARRPLGLSGTGQRCCSRSHGVLTRRAHTARSYTAYAQLNASRRCRAHTFSSLEAQARSDQIMALPSVPQREGRWAYYGVTYSIGCFRPSVFSAHDTWF